MGYRNLRACLADLEQTGQLVRIEREIDPDLEAAEIHRRVFQAGGPAVYYARVKGTPFPMVSNLFGTLERTRFLFRDALDGVRQLVRLKIDPSEAARAPWRFLGVPRTAFSILPRRVRKGPILECQTQLSALPRQRSWPKDGGSFITLPQVYTEDPRRPGLARSNLGMYRVQLDGGRYQPEREVGLHYQIHRGIGVHHAAALEQGIDLKVNVIVGGPPALAVAAVMPLPEGLSELGFAGALARRRLAMVTPVASDGAPGLPFPAEADFVITGTVDPDRRLPEGPFGDHLGYYSLEHDFPVLRVERVFHRPDAVWPFTVVGRPPQEDSAFGAFIHELTGPIIPTVVHGVHAVHAVDAAGVHPLLLAIGSERYVPYAEVRRPQELLTCANAILGQGQLSLAKYLFLVAREDDPSLDIHDIPAFLRHLLERLDPRFDLHFQTATTIDTLDYSGTGLNQGSKLVFAAAGPKRRSLASAIPGDLRLPPGFVSPRVCLPGILAISGPGYEPDRTARERSVGALCAALATSESFGGPNPTFPLIALVDDGDFVARSLDNFLWVTFTRSNPAADVHGVDSSIVDKHWGCRGSVIIDARIKPRHAPVLEPDPDVARRVDALGAPGGPLHGII